MQDFKYKAINSSSGEKIEGVIQGSDEKNIIDQLNALGHLPITVTLAKRPSLTDLLNKDIFGSTKIAAKDLTLLCREIALLLKAGVTLERSLEIVISAAHTKSLTALVTRLLNSLREGRSLAQASRENETDLPPLFIDMIRAGEEASALPAVFERLAAYFEKQQEMREKIKSSLMYPTILLITSGLSIIFLIAFVLPQFQPIFESSGKDLPWLSQALIDLGDSVSRFWWLILTSVIGMILVARLQLKKPDVQSKMDHFVQKLPLIGRLFTDKEVAALAHTLTMLISNGTALHRALEITRETSRNAVTKRWLETAEREVKEGNRLSQSFKNEGYPDLACQLIGIGEETGKLGDMLAHIAGIYEQNTVQQTQRLLTLLSPALTLLLGGVVAVIVGSLLVTVMEINEFAF